MNVRKLSKGFAFGMIFVLLAAIFIWLPENGVVSDASAETWTQTTDTDFETGELENVEIVGSGESAVLQLKTQTGLGTWHQQQLKPSARFDHEMVFDSLNNKIVLFGGFTSTSPYYNDETWVYDISSNTWTQMNPATKPSARYGHTMVYDSTNNKVVLFGGWDDTNRFDDTWVYDLAGDTWTQMNPVTKPSARQNHAMTYDSTNNKIVLFGGNDGPTRFQDTWVYNIAGNIWTQMNPATKPSARYNHAMVYDSTNNKIVLFGGYDSYGYDDDETWVYDVVSDTWTQMNPTSKPSARSLHAMVYDSDNNKIVLFGGYYYDYTSHYDDETWVYDVASDTWTQMNPPTKPSTRRHHDMVYDSANNKVVLFGGYTGISNDETWVYDVASDTWTQMNPTTKPSARVRHTIVYNSVNNKVVLFGGFDSGGYDDETWVYDVASDTWTQMNPATKPSARDQFAMVYDSVNNKVVLFGGYTSTSPYVNDETWVYDLASDTWTQMNPTTKPSARFLHAMAYDSANNKVVLFGGDDSSGRDDETWVYDVASDTWTQMNPATKPSARDEHAMAYDSANNKVVLFGGDDLSGRDDETWVYDVASDTWTQMNPATRPLARKRHCMAYDFANNKVVLFGGNYYSGGYHYLDDTWIYDMASNVWIQMNSMTKPSVRNVHAMTFDTANNKVVVFGGSDGSTSFDHTWVYNLNDYYNSGTYTSKTFTTDNFKWQSITWATDTDPDGFVRFQVAVNDDGKTWNFVGPDGTSSTFYDEVTGGELYSGYTGKYLRYKAYLTTSYAGNSPKLNDVTISYTTEIPETPEAPNVKLTSPNGGEDWMKGSIYPITWNAQGDFNETPVYLSYSTDTGISWYNIPNRIDNWVQLNPSIKPSSRSGHAMAYDTVNEKLILFGGSKEYSPYDNLDDTWTYDLRSNTWTQMNPTQKPYSPSGHSMIYDSVNEKIVFYGREETWTYDVESNIWTNMNPTQNPSAYAEQSMVYDSKNNKIVLFGGVYYEGGNDYYSDEIWTYNTATNNWIQMNPATHPPGRFDHAMAYDSSNNKIVMFGGRNSTQSFNDTWIYDLTTDTWIEKSINCIPGKDKPQTMSSHKMVFDPTNDKVVLFGFGEIWFYDVAADKWTEMDPTIKPSVLYRHELVYDSQQNRIILFCRGSGYYGETWVYPNTTEYMPNTGHYNWLVPNIETANALIKVTVTDIYGNTISDTSDASFAIDPPLKDWFGQWTNNEIADNQPASGANLDNEQPTEQDTIDDSSRNLGPKDRDTKPGDEPVIGLLSWLIIILLFLSISIVLNLLLISRSRRHKKQKAELSKVSPCKKISRRTTQPISKQQMSQYDSMRSLILRIRGE